jgi:hypothetical protein
MCETAGLHCYLHWGCSAAEICDNSGSSALTNFHFYTVSNSLLQYMIDLSNGHEISVYARRQYWRI